MAEVDTRTVHQDVESSAFGDDFAKDAVDLSFHRDVGMNPKARVAGFGGDVFGNRFAVRIGSGTDDRGGTCF